MFGLEGKRLELLAPLSGKVVPLELVPDPVFAERMMGDGVALMPDEGGNVLAPCDGELAALFPTGHAFGIRGAHGLEILVHVGIDTVSLEGEGFALLASAGDTVKAGEPIVRFDLALVASKAPSLLTPVIITTGELVKSLSAAFGRVRAGVDVLLTVEAK
ncbi:MAG: PTS glucose transporter subunit IIA [Synergistaceae bacterium]|nr:PTS glucose transporter subunit IIA [Synergistota bacterium]NLM70756.1 PTS glucose transporter subunit IIA [Synergistaceae bacterium]